MNAHGILRGGAIFMPADFAFAAAANSHGQTAFALHMDANCVATAPAGARLVAKATEEHLGNRTVLHHMAVKTEEGKLIAACYRMVYRRHERFTEGA